MPFPSPCRPGPRHPAGDGRDRDPAAAHPLPLLGGRGEPLPEPQPRDRALLSLCPRPWQELFQKCHPVHFLNSRALGVTDKSAAVPR